MGPYWLGLQDGIDILFTLLGLGGITLLCLIGLAPLYVIWSYSRQTAKLGSQGRFVQGVVHNRWTEVDDENWTVYKVGYRFEITHPDGTITKVTGVEGGQEAYEGLSIGDTVWVRYLPDQPAVSRLEWVARKDKPETG